MAKKAAMRKPVTEENRQTKETPEFRDPSELSEEDKNKLKAARHRLENVQSGAIAVQNLDVSSGRFFEDAKTAAGTIGVPFKVVNATIKAALLSQARGAVEEATAQVSSILRK